MIKVEFEQHDNMWYCYTTDMPGMGEQGSSKLNAFEELMISLKVKIMYDNNIQI